MKSIKFVIGLALVSLAAQAQTGYDAHRLSENELNGTARFVGMGGAMGALGADISVIGTNPAGIGLFRRNDVSTTFGFNTTLVKSDFAGTSMKEKNTKASFDQAGFVYSMKIGNRTDLRYINFGFNYHKSNNLNKIFSSGGFLNDFSSENSFNDLSLSGQILNMMYNYYDTENILDIHKAYDEIYNYGLENSSSKINPYENNSYGYGYPFIGVMGIRSELLLKGEKAEPKDQKYLYRVFEQNFYNTMESGGVYDYDFNVSFNLKDKMYFGVTLGVHDVNYERSSLYQEYTLDPSTNQEIDYFDLYNVMHTEGTGFDVKVGAIFRPIEDSSFRFGFAVHSPIWYQLTDIYRSELLFPNYNLTETIVESPSDYLAGDILQDYKITTPWKFNVNTGIVVGSIMALGAEYEFTDYSTSKIKNIDGFGYDYQNQKIKDDMKAVHTIRLGMETMITNNVSLRAGYNYSSSVFPKNAYKDLDLYDMRTDTEFNNKFDQHTATIGLGYRGRILYVDAAYKYNMYKSDFYAFSDEALQATKQNNERHQVLFTIGARF